MIILLFFEDTSLAEKAVVGASLAFYLKQKIIVKYCDKTAS